LSTLFDAARDGDAQAVRAHLGAGADVAAADAQGFTALHRAVMGAGSPEVLRLLLAAGAPVEQHGPGGRTALYLAAEFATTTDAVQVLLDGGADPDVSDEHGNHVVDNAGAPEVQQLLSGLTGQPVPAEPASAPEPVKLGNGRWKAARTQIDVVFQSLAEAGIVARAGDFAECAAAYRDRGGGVGLCYYTEQDVKRAKRTSRLPLGVWGAPDGDQDATTRTATLVVEHFRQHGFAVEWDGSGASRPVLDLRDSR
jgi:hypothetical protein